MKSERGSQLLSHPWGGLGAWLSLSVCWLIYRAHLVPTEVNRKLLSDGKASWHERMSIGSECFTGNMTRFMSPVIRRRVFSRQKNMKPDDIADLTYLYQLGYGARDNQELANKGLP